MTKLWFLILIILVIFSGCRTIKHTDKQKEIVNIRYVDRLQDKDSVYVYKHDSIFVKIKGDTVFVEKFRTEIKDRLHIISDTIELDSIIYKVKIIIQEKQQSKMDIFWQQIGKILFIVFLLYILIKILRRKLNI